MNFPEEFYPPKAFTDITCLIFTDDMKEYENLDAYFDNLIHNGAWKEKKIIVLEFIEKLLSSNISDDELYEIWQESNPTVAFPGANTRRVLQLIHDACIRQIKLDEEEAGKAG